METRKMFAALAIAMFCVVAFAAIAAEDSDAASTKNYEIYVEVIGNDGSVEDVVYVYFSSEADNPKYAEAATAALSAAGLKDVKVSYNLEKGSIWIESPTPGINATFYSDGTTWASIMDTKTEYINNTKVGLAVCNGYISEDVYAELPITEAAKWSATGWGDPYAYIKILEGPAAIGEVKEYTSYLTIIDDDLVSFRTTSISFKAENNISAWIYGFNAATKALGNNIFSNVSAALYGDYVSVAYSDGGMTACWVKENKKWVSATETAKQYPAASETDFELKNGWITEEQYKGLEKGQQSLWQEDSMMKGYYQRVATGEIVEEVADLLVIGVIAAIIIIAIIIVLIVVFVKKKKTTA